jgi:F0F1-type ATP synthase gamma subunit
MSSNRGLCGVFNSNVQEIYVQLQEQKEFRSYASENKLDFYVFGRRIGDFLRKKQCNIIERHDEIIEKPLTENVSHKLRKYSSAIKMENGMK